MVGVLPDKDDADRATGTSGRRQSSIPPMRLHMKRLDVRPPLTPTVLCLVASLFTPSTALSNSTKPTPRPTTTAPVVVSTNGALSDTTALIIGLCTGILLIFTMVMVLVCYRRRLQRKAFLARLSQHLMSPSAMATVRQPSLAREGQGHLVRINHSTRSSRIDFAPSSCSSDTDTLENYTTSSSWQVQQPDQSLPVRTIPASQVRPLRDSSFQRSFDLELITSYVEHPAVRSSTDTWFATQRHGTPPLSSAK
ncbi:hypothetical protein LEN26_020349 [Aphanomyces euteiches]|nr:hypothetical protein LEN26_020349 [Aphanomyces euteiches]KAH9129419.1 hypothetical protein AeMF1_000525 [Aphanomyces euteiches]KAH9195011.1 hypothetical protein AeNC1_003004 [Aphanomyces euteiches]